MRATLDAFSFRPALGQRIVQKHDLWEHKLEPYAFVPVQRWLDALHEIQRTVGPAIVRRIGRALIDRADVPRSLSTPEALLEKLDDIHQANHRGQVGRYRVSRIDGLLVVACETPYPRAFEHGLVEGICERAKRAGRAFDLAFDEGPPNADLTCTMRVRLR